MPRRHEASPNASNTVPDMIVDSTDGSCPGESLLPKQDSLRRLLSRVWRSKNDGPGVAAGICVYRPIVLRPSFLHCCVTPASKRHANIDFETPSGILSGSEILSNVVDRTSKVSLQDLRPASGSGDRRYSQVDLALDFALPRGSFATALLRDVRGVEMASAWSSARRQRRVPNPTSSL
eukprot:TRINITY_DN14073_c0_g1_i1.p1 TRINITY_DN14073_c0_g1~~TRINITY_DN14073_c0_g1_i1.p1  ORF type:complete len:178 (-),score=17.75 TRINITY_DN14073_c0_g1_i1:142-675(-)